MSRIKLVFSRMIRWAALLAFTACPCFAQGAIEYGPYVSLVTPTSAAITWITNENTSDNKVIWGTDSPVNEAPEDTSEKNSYHNFWNHIVYLNGLSANTDYTYKVSSDDSESSEYTFTSGVNWGEPFIFGQSADNQGSPGDLGNQLEHGIQNDAHFFLFAADFVGDGSKIRSHGHGWEDNLFDVANAYPNDFGVSKNFMASHAIYNSTSWHDLGFYVDDGAVDNFPFFWTFPDNGMLPSPDFENPDRYRQEFVYGFGYGNTYFICISSTQHWEGSRCGGLTADDQVDWLREQLEIGKRDYAFRVVFGHTCLYGTGSGDTRPMEEMFPEYDVTIHFHGHKHEFQVATEDGVDHITGPPSNKGQHGLVTVDGDQMTFRAYNSNGGVIGERTYQADPDVVPPVKAARVSKTGRIKLTRYGSVVYMDLPEYTPGSHVSIHDVKGNLITTLKASPTVAWDVEGLKKGVYVIYQRDIKEKWALY